MNSLKHLNRTSKALGVAGLAGVVMVSGCCTKSYKTASYRQGSASYASTASEGNYSASTTEQVQTPTPTGRTEEAKNMVVPLFQENVNVGKREVESGTVRLRKVVKTETVNQPIELRREELVIDRDSGNARNSGEQVLAQPFQEQETVIRLKREEPVIEKQTVSAGQVTVQTRTTQEQRNIQSQVRREDIDIDKHGAQNVIIGQNVQRSVRVEDSGAGETATGTGAGYEANVISSPDQLTTGNVTSYNGRKVHFRHAKVHRIIGERLIVLNADNGQQIYVVTDGRENNRFHQGDTVMITGTVKAGNANDSGLSGEAAQELSSRPVYIQAQTVQIGNQGQDQNQNPNSTSTDQNQNNQSLTPNSNDQNQNSTPNSTDSSNPNSTDSQNQNPK